MTTISKTGPREYVGYVRVSQVKGRDSDENKSKFHSPDMQLERIKQSIETAEGTYVDFKYDPDRSGYQKHVVREGWNEAVAWVMQDPKNRGIVAYDTSRLSRNLWKLLGDVQHTLVPAGARVIVAGEGIDTVQPNWQMALQMAGIMAEQFSIKMGERWRDVHKRRIAKRQSPVGKVPYGYRRVDDGEGIEPDPITADVVSRAYGLYLDGEGLRGICQTFNRDGVPAPKGGEWSTTTLSRILRNPAGVGRLVFEGVESEGGWEPIVNEATWDAFQRMQAGRVTSPNRKRSGGWVLAGIAKCAHCGLNLTVNYLPIEVEAGDDETQVPMPKGHAKKRGLGDGATWSLAESKRYKNQHSTAMCTTYRQKGKQACPGVFMVRTALETQFTYFLGTLQDEIAAATTGKAAEAREDARTAAAARVSAARADLEGASSSRVNLAVMRADCTLDEAQFRDALRRVDARADEARAALAQAEADHAAAEPLADAWEQIQTGGEGMTQAAWNSVLRRVIARVEVSNDALLFVPTVGNPVTWDRHNLPKGAAVKGRPRRSKHYPDDGAVFPKPGSADAARQRDRRKVV